MMIVPSKDGCPSGTANPAKPIRKAVVTQAVSKSKSSGTLEAAVKVVFLILMGFIGYVFTINLFILFFVPIIGWLVWTARDKISNLEQRIAALEKPSEPKPDKT
jgi:hypothetical protein